jgi:hypothetical protein
VPIKKDDEMKYIYILFTIFLLYNISYTQQYPIPPSPMCGWDSLKSRINYPNLARIAGVEEQVYVSFNVDTSGAIANIIIHRQNNFTVTISDNFQTAIISALKSTKWIPEKYQGKTRRSNLSLSIDFIVVTEGSSHRHIIIEGNRQPQRATIGN